MPANEDRHLPPQGFVVSLCIFTPHHIHLNSTGPQSYLGDAPSYQDLPLLTLFCMGQQIGPSELLQRFCRDSSNSLSCCSPQTAPHRLTPHHSLCALEKITHTSYGSRNIPPLENLPPLSVSVTEAKNSTQCLTNQCPFPGSVMAKKGRKRNGGGPH